MIENQAEIPSDWSERVLAFWFDEVGPQRWFIKDAALDARIGELFGPVYEHLAQTPSEDLVADATQALAAVVVLDQFSRNMFRDDAKAFALDDKALDIARAAIARGFDKQIETDRRIFMYLPFEHSEDGADQERSIELIGSLGRPDLLKWAQAHKDVIDRFGRYPHRNVILGRVSTPEELVFLKEPGSGF